MKKKPKKKPKPLPIVEIPVTPGTRFRLRFRYRDAVHEYEAAFRSMNVELRPWSSGTAIIEVVLGRTMRVVLPGRYRV